MDETGEEKNIFPKNIFVLGADLGYSEWLVISEEMNQTFADATNDPIVFQINGQKYVHGFMTLSLLSYLAKSAFKKNTKDNQQQQGYLMNYGLNRIRLINPIPLGARVRAAFKVSETGIKERKSVTVIPLQFTIEIEGCSRPATAGEWLLAYEK